MQKNNKTQKDCPNTMLMTVNKHYIELFVSPYLHYTRVTILSFHSYCWLSGSV